MEKELYNSLVLDTYIRLIKDKYPEILVEDLMEYAGIETYELGDTSVWFTQAQVNRFHEKLSTITDNLKIAREAGRFAADPKCLGELRGMILSLGGIHNAFKFLGRYVGRLNRSATYTTRKTGKNQIELTVTPFEGVTEQEFQCENRKGNFRGIADAFTHKEITISHPECLFKGGNCCRYLISWEESGGLPYLGAARTAAGAAALIMALLWITSAGSLVSTAALTAALILFLTLGWIAEKASSNRLSASLSQVYDTKEELLEQIDINSENARVIIDIGQALKLGRPDEPIFDRIAQITGRRLKYDRVIIMIANDDNSALVYRGGSGFTPEEQTFLNHYHISLESPSEGVFYESFTRAVPIVVNDMAKLKQKSTTRSFRLAEVIKPLAFIVCPISYDHTVAGLIIAGNIDTPKWMGRNDKNLMMGVAQQLGTAFQKQKMEAEHDAFTQQLAQAQKSEALGMLASGIAHDFNNILFPIMGYTDLCITLSQSGENIIDHLYQIKKASARAQNLVRQILAFSRQGEQDFAPINISPIVKETLQLLRASLPATIEIKKRIHRDIKPILADPTVIHQIVMNLCTNAFQAMEEGEGTLTVSLTEEESLSGSLAENIRLDSGPYLKLSVSDTGHGMSTAVIGKIFDPYFTTKEKGKGTGLGLSVTHNIVRQLRGHIDVTSTPGQGSSFDVYLPQIQNPPACPSTEPDNIPPGGTERLMVIDDNGPVLELLEEVFNEKGYRVTAFLDPSKALEAYRTAPGEVDLVITDMTMPGMTGMDLAKKIFAVNPKVPIILCTGYSERIHKSKVIAMGIRELFMKPLDINELAAAVRQMLDSRNRS